MNEPNTPPPPPASEPSAPPPPPANEPAPASSGGSGNNTIMVILSYLWILAIIPLLVEKDDKEIQWHAKHGLVILALEVIVWVVLTILGATGILACLAGILSLFIWLAFVVVRLVCIVKGVNGERFLLPGVSQYADKF
jgi:uncharacterized membrane protein